MISTARKMRVVQCLAVLVLVACYADLTTAQNKVVCYFGSWAGYRQGNGKFTVETINPDLCTHLIYSFVGIDASGNIRLLDSWNDLNLKALERFNNIKIKHPSVKTMVAVGGWNEGSVGFSQVMANPTTRANFINSAVSFVKQYNFDGFDLDWEYPAQRGGAAADKVNFVLLLKEMRAKFDANGGLLLSAAVAASKASVATSYDVPSLSQYLDFINIMTYDLHGPWEPTTGQNAPLFASSLDRTAEALELNLNASIHFWLSQGAAPSKLVVGMGTYGRSFTLQSVSSRLLGSPASGAGPQGPYTQEAGMLGYNEICEQQASGGWQVSWDDEQKVPFASKGNVWVGYDNVQSIRAKSELALSLGLGGGMIWSLETDDFLGLCGGPKFPLLSTIHDVLIGPGPPASTSSAAPTSSTAAPSSSSAAPTSSTAAPTSSTAAPTSSSAAPSSSSAAPTSSTAASSSSSAAPTVVTTTATTTTGATPTGLCQQEGYVRDPVNCNVFYYCQQNSAGFYQFKFTCPATTVFDTVFKVCNYPSQVQC